MWHVWGAGAAHTGFRWGDLRERDHLEEPEYNIKLHHQEVGWRGMECTALAQERDRWWALVNALMNFRVP
jgi:hypothetical protein